MTPPNDRTAVTIVLTDLSGYFRKYHHYKNIKRNTKTKKKDSIGDHIKYVLDDGSECLAETDEEKANVFCDYFSSIFNVEKDSVFDTLPIIENLPSMPSIHFDFRNLLPDTFVMLYKTLVRCHLEYANCVWSPYRQMDIKKLEKVQMRAAGNQNGSTAE